jgi:hypothetical protein
MKPRMYFGLGMWVGIVLGGIVALFGANQRWSLAAYEHGCAVYKTNFNSTYSQLHWMWADDYFAEEAKSNAVNRRLDR